MTYQTERMDDGTVVIENQTIKGGIVLDVSQHGAIIRNCTIQMSAADKAAIQLTGAKSTWLDRLFWFGFRWHRLYKMLVWLSGNKPKHQVLIQNNMIVPSADTTH